jgi:hypothetical protein
LPEGDLDQLADEPQVYEAVQGMAAVILRMKPAPRGDDQGEVFNSLRLRAGG